MIFICDDIRKVVVLKVLLSLSEREKFWNIHLTFSRLQRPQKCDFCCCVCCASGNVFYERAVFTISGYFYSLRKRILLCTTLQPWEVSPAKLFSFRSPPFTFTSIQVVANKLLGHFEDSIERLSGCAFRFWKRSEDNFSATFICLFASLGSKKGKSWFKGSWCNYNFKLIW